MIIILSTIEKYLLSINYAMVNGNLIFLDRFSKNTSKELAK